MNLIREYIRRLLTEVAKGPQDLPDEVIVVIQTSGEGFYTYYGITDDPTVMAGDPYYPVGMHGNVEVGWIGPYEAIGGGTYGGMGDLGKCDGAGVVIGSEAHPSGWGPLLYDVAMEYATMKGGGLIADRSIVSADARRVWDYYLNNRSDVTAYQLDDLGNTLTPQEEDNCDQKVARRPYEPYKYDASGKVDVNWVDSALSKRYTKPPTTIEKLKSLGKLVKL